MREKIKTFLQNAEKAHFYGLEAQVEYLRCTNILNIQNLSLQCFNTMLFCCLVKKTCLWNTNSIVGV